MFEQITIYIKEQAAKANKIGSFSKQEQILFAKRLAFLMRAGVPILESLKLIQKQIRTKAGKAMFEEVVKDVSAGHFLSTALSKHGKIFNEFAINIINVGETGGMLSDNLNYLADELKKKQALKKKVMSALFYPIFIVVATLGIVILLTVVVFPKVLPIFTSINVPLPLTTRILMQVSRLFIAHGWLIILGFIALIFAFLFALKNYEFKKLFDRFTLKLPIAGNIAQSYYMANFCRTMGLLLKTDARLSESLKISARTTENLIYKTEIEKIVDVVSKGQKISDHMNLNPHVFPVMASHMVAIGETAGNLSETFIYLAEMYEQDVDELTRNLSSLIEPVLMVFMGLLVGFVAISIITPIYSITQKLHP